MLRVSTTHPSSRVHKTVTTVSGSGHSFCAATSLQRAQAWPHWREVAAQKNITSTGCCSYSMGTPDDWCG